MHYDLYHGDCRDAFQYIADNSIDVVITDPPYPHIKKPYGYWSTEEWWDLIVVDIIPEIRRVLKPSGSAVFILQSNSEKCGKLRSWLFEFQAWICREWNVVQDVWWWNHCALPTICAGRKFGLMRPSVKALVWCGEPDCYKNQNSLLLPAASGTHARDIANLRKYGSDVAVDYPSGYAINRERIMKSRMERGGVTPFNCWVIGGASNRRGHSASFPYSLACTWISYICPPGGIVLDPFIGSGTTMAACIEYGVDCIGMERFPLRGKEVSKKTNPAYVIDAYKSIEDELYEGDTLDFWEV